MEIVIAKDIKLVSDQNGRWTLRTFRPLTKGPRAGQKAWAEDGTYDTLQWALRGAAKRLLTKGQGTATLEQLASKLEKIEFKLTMLGKQALDFEQEVKPQDGQPDPFD